MSLCIQDPTDPTSEYLIDIVLDACSNAIRGGGAFAFLSAGGVKLFLQDSAFIEFAGRGSFDLIVGVDAITDTAAIKALNNAKIAAPSLETHIHIPDHPRSIFHPKVAWFETPEGGILITGSGNLTSGGLRWNIEAFDVNFLSAEEIADVVVQWNAFKLRCTENLYTTDDPKVTEILERNAERKRATRAERVEGVEGVETCVEPAEQAGPEENVEAVDNVDVVPPVTPTSNVLVAEIPQSGNRWKQANFDLHTFTTFFGASTTVSRKAYFFHVRADGTVGHQEVRPAVSVASQNYRFELDAATGIPYPSNGRPIGVFVRVATRTFMYMLVMPTDPAHPSLIHILDEAIPNPGQRMRRVVFNADQVQSAWPDSPLWGRLVITS